MKESDVLQKKACSSRRLSKKLCTEKEEAKKGDLFEETKANAEKDIDQLFKVSLGDEYNVVIEWRSAE